MQISLAACLALMPFSIHAAGLGRLDVSSSLGEPLKAQIELLLVSPDELASMVAAIAPEDAYATQGIPHLAIHNSIKVELAKNAAGLPMLKLISNQPITDPYLDILIQVDWASGRLQREYTVLLDPPGYQATADIADAPLTEPLQSSASANTSSVTEPARPTVGSQSSVKKIRKSREPVEQDSFADGSDTRVIKTKPGDTLSSVAKELQVEGVSLDQMLIGLYENNQEAFFSGNMNRLKVGRIIKAPTKDSLIAISPQEAKTSVKLHSANWNAYRSRLAGSVAVVSTTAETEQKQSASGKISAAEDKAMPAKVGPQDVVKLSAGEKQAGNSADAKMTALQEEATAREKSLKDAEARTIALEKQIQDMKKLLALKNQSMAELQKNAKPVPAEAPQAELGLLDGLMNLTLLVGVLVAGLLVAAWTYLRNKRRKSLDGFGRDVIMPTDLQANTAGPATSNDSFLSHMSQAVDNQTASDSNVDPIAEAEVYMAYGRDAQAEAILKNAIAKEPTLYERHIKLLEIYVARQDAFAFEDIARDLHTTLANNDPVWIKVTELGLSVDPENSLYDLSNVSPEESLDDKELVVDDFSDEAVSKNNDLDFSLEAATPDIGEVKTDSADVATEEVADNSMDFDLPDIAVEAPAELPTANAVSEFPSIEPILTTNDEPQAVELDISGTDDETQTQASDLDVELNATVADSGIAESPASDVDKNIADEIKFDLDFSIDTPDSSSVDTSAEVKASELSFELPEIEDPVIKADEGKSQSSELEANRFDLSSISFDLEDTENELIEPPVAKPKKASSAKAKSKKVLSDSPELDVKLDLVAAYIDMGDLEGARELLVEVIKEGGAQQKERAQQLLDSLA
jgi:pilus assembly protein FimV